MADGRQPLLFGVIGLLSSVVTVGYLERGEYSPSLYLALRSAAYFEVPVEVIFSTDPFPRLGSASASAG